METKTKHTPGPWAVELPYQEPGVYVTAGDPRRTNPLICRLIDQAQTQEGRANARLIAAAPDLLDALEVLEGVVNVAELEPVAVFAAVEQARAAIKKATGTE